MPRNRSRFHRRLLACIVTVGALVSLAAGQAEAEIRYHYDALGRLRAVIDLVSDTAVYTYDAVGNLLSISRHPSSQLTLIEIPETATTGACNLSLLGTGFDPTPGQTAVTVNGVAATVQTATSTELVICLPVGATTGLVAVTTPGGSVSSSAPLTVTAALAGPTVTGFTPTLGDPGTAVTITGTGFETEPTRNNVRVGGNGARAAVSTAGATTLGATVPVGATSGRVTVTTPQGTAVSAADFFVPPPPDTAATVAFTGRWAVPETRTTTTIPASRTALIVFEAAAGQRGSVGVGFVTAPASILRIDLFDPTGVKLAPEVSTGTVYYREVPALPRSGTYALAVQVGAGGATPVTVSLYDPSDVLGTITPGGATVTVTFASPGQNARLTFAGTAGQRVAFWLNGIGTLYGVTDVALLRPDATTLGTTSVSTNDRTFWEAQTLPTTGTYTLSLNPRGGVTGSLAVSAYDVPPDDTGPITPGGPATTVTTTVPGQQGRRTFQGTAGQRVSLAITNVTYGVVYVSLLRPDGTTQSGPHLARGGDSLFIDPQTLATAGTYTLLVDPNNLDTGSVRLTLYDVLPDLTGPIQAGDPGVTVTLTTPGQAARLTFEGTAGRRASLLLSAPPVLNWTRVQLLKPDGGTLGTINGNSASGFGFLDAVTLPVNGTYTVVVDPIGSNTGTATVTRYDFVDVTASTTIGASPLTVTLPTPGQNASVTFPGTGGQTATVRVTGNTFGSVAVSLLRPDGTTMTSTTSGAASFTLASQTLATTGTYTVRVDPSSSYTGSLAVQVTSP